MILIGSLTSPFVRKVRIAMYEKQINYVFQLDDVWASNSEIYKYNPLGKIPCLLTDQGKSIFDSHVIIEYLDIFQPLPKLIPESSDDKINCRILEAMADGIIDASVTIFYENKRMPDYRDQTWIDRQYKKINITLETLNNELEHQYNKNKEDINIAYISLACALDYLNLRFKHLEWNKSYSFLSEFLSNFSSKKSFINTSNKT